MTDRRTPLGMLDEINAAMEQNADAKHAIVPAPVWAHVWELIGAAVCEGDMRGTIDAADAFTDIEFEVPPEVSPIPLAVHDAARAELETVKAERDDAEIRYQNVRSDLTDQSEKLERIRDERDELRAEIRRRDEACDPDSEPCHAVLDEAEKARNGEAALAGALDTTRWKLHQAEADRDEARNELGEVKTRLGELRSDLREMFDREAAVKNAIGRGAPGFEASSISVTMGPPQDGGDDG